jgi:hypothetical protein
MCAIASMYQSKRVVERGVKQREREDLKFLIQVFWYVTLFQLAAGDLLEKNNNSCIFRIKKNQENDFFVYIGLLCSN